MLFQEDEIVLFWLLFIGVLINLIFLDEVQFTDTGGLEVEMLLAVSYKLVMNLLLLGLFHLRLRILKFHFDWVQKLDFEGRFRVIICVIPKHYVVI